VSVMTLVACVAVMAPPPQEPVSPLGVEIVRPAGSVSVKPTPERAWVALVFWTVKLNVVDPFSGMDAAPKTLLMVGGAATVTLALEVLPVPPTVAVTWTLLFFTPPVVPFTLTETVQLALAARVPPDRLTDPAPAVAVAVPPQVLLRPGVEATTKPAGRVSVKASPVSAKPLLGLLRLKVNEVVPFSGMFDAPKAFVMAGGLLTVRFADAVLPVPPFVEVIAAVVFVY
jgi:hypothetical protein